MRFFPVISFFKLMKGIFIKAVELIQLSWYNDFNIAKLFRKQGAQIGDNCRIIIRQLSSEPYLIKIGNHVAIAGGVVLLTRDEGTWIFQEDNPGLQAYGSIIIEDNCVIGQNAVIYPNIRIGNNSIVASGAIVISDIPPNSIAMGAPARVLSSVQRYKKKCIEMWKEQCPPGIHIEEGHNWWDSKYYSKNREKLKKHLLSLFLKQGKLKNNKSEFSKTEKQ